ncbi:hypothetical protein V565_336680, partial [Rhizoctonia solani 123E]
MIPRVSGISLAMNTRTSHLIAREVNAKASDELCIVLDLSLEVKTIRLDADRLLALNILRADSASNVFVMRVSALIIDANVTTALGKAHTSNKGRSLALLDS